MSTNDKLRPILLAMLLAALVACGATPADTVPPPTTTTAPAALAASATPAPTREPSATPAPTREPSATAAPTREPSATSAPTATVPPMATETLVAAPAEPTLVEIQLFQFQPATVEVPLGATVTWSNSDDIQHSATSGTAPDADGRFDTGFFEKGESRSITFEEAGTYLYFCDRHPSMIGTVVVEAP